MPITLEQLSPSRVKLVIEIPFADLKPHIAKAYKNIAEQVNIPGFRRGKVPPAIIDQRFGRGAILQEALNDVLPSAYAKAVEETRIVPLGDPDIDLTRLEDGEVVEFTAEVDVRADFDVPAFDTLSAVVKPLAVTDEEVDERINVMRQRFATTTEVDREAADGDVVVLDLQGSRDGAVLPDATAEGLTYKLGSGGMLPGLDEAVKGLKAGDTATFTSQLVGGPEAGLDTDIKVTLTKVSQEELPEVNDDFAQLVSEFDTVAEMRADLAQRVQQLARLAQADEARDKVLESLIDQVDFEVPERIVAAEVEARKAQISDQLARAGYTLERYLQETATEEPKNPEEFWKSIEEGTRKALKAQILLDKIADDAELGVDQSDLMQAIIQRAQRNQTSPEQEAQAVMQNDVLQPLMQEIRRNKALNLVIEGATITDEDGAVVDLAGLAAEDSLLSDEDADWSDEDEEWSDEDEDLLDEFDEVEIEEYVSETIIEAGLLAADVLEEEDQPVRE